MTDSILADALARVLRRVDGARERAGRTDAVQLVAVSKTVSVERVLALAACGQSLFGENRVQEALPKIEAAGAGLRWHLIGRLQKNKVRHAVGAFELIHSVDDEVLAREIDRRAAAAGLVQRVLVQVNVSGESTKGGVAGERLFEMLESIAGLSHLEPCGLMAVPAAALLPEASRPAFVRLRRLRDDAERRCGRALPELSMGMSHDFEPAIEEGATLIRVGSAIFGVRSSIGPND